jgi:hypothetical protein
MFPDNTYSIAAGGEDCYGDITLRVRPVVCPAVNVVLSGDRIRKTQKICQPEDTACFNNKHECGH